MRNLLKYCEAIVKALSMATFMASWGLLFYEVASRYFAGVSNDWILEMVVYLAVGSCLLYAGVIFRRGGHVRVDFLIAKVGGRARTMLEALLDVVTLAVVGLLLWSGILLVRRLHLIGLTSESSARFPLWAVEAIVPVGMAILFVYVLISIISRIRALFHVQTPVQRED